MSTINENEIVNPTFIVEYARSFLDLETEQFNNDPIGFVKSMNWNNAKKYIVLKGQLDFNESDLTDLTIIIRQEERRLGKEFKHISEIWGNNKIDDFIANWISDKILAEYNKVVKEDFILVFNSKDDIIDSIGINLITKLGKKPYCYYHGKRYNVKDITLKGTTIRCIKLRD